MNTEIYFRKIQDWLTKGNNIELNNTFIENSSPIPLDTDKIPVTIRKLVIEVLYYFESASLRNLEGDSYLFYKFFTIALHKSLNIRAILNGDLKTWQDPPNLLKMNANEVEGKYLSQLFPDVNSEDSNPIKQNFIDWFTSMSEEINEKYNLSALPFTPNQIERILHAIYRRDFLFNFRPVKFTKRIFRSPDPARFLSESNLLETFLIQNKITSIIDLRGEKEAANSYLIQGFLKKLSIHYKIVDFNEPKNNKGPSGYIGKLVYQKSAVKTVFEQVLSNTGNLLIHCASGKDRTGVMAALFQLLAKTPEKAILEDYTASGCDSREERISDILTYIQKIGGIEKYLISCGISQEHLKLIEQQIRN